MNIFAPVVRENEYTEPLIGRISIVYRLFSMSRAAESKCIVIVTCSVCEMDGAGVVVPDNTAEKWVVSEVAPP